MIKLSGHFSPTLEENVFTLIVTHLSEEVNTQVPFEFWSTMVKTSIIESSAFLTELISIIDARV